MGHLQLYSYLEVSEFHSCLQLSSLMLSAHWTTSQGILTYLLTGDRLSWTLRVEAALLVMTLPSLFRRGDDDELAKENTKNTAALKGSIVLSASRYDTTTGELAGVFQ